MANTPEAEVAIDRDLVARLLAQQFPSYAHHEVGELSAGWDNVIARLGSELAVRLPRRSVAVPLIENEQRWLPGFAERISVPIPAPVASGTPSDLFPWAWSVVPWFPGSPVVRRSPAQRSTIAVDLAAFIAELHVAAPVDAPHNPVRGVPLVQRSDVVVERLGSGAIPRSAELLKLWSRLRDTQLWSGPAMWLHGDLHPANLIEEEGRLAAVIDFGDVTSGDPATDLAVAWLAFDADGRRTFIDALPDYYRTDEALLARAAGWGLALGTAFAAHSDDNPAMAAIGAHALSELLSHHGAE